MTTSKTFKTFENGKVLTHYLQGEPITEPQDGVQAWARNGSNWIGVTYVEGYGWVESADVAALRRQMADSS